MGRSKLFTTHIILLALLSFGGFAYADSKAAKRHMARGAAAMEVAKSPTDYRDAGYRKNNRPFDHISNL